MTARDPASNGLTLVSRLALRKELHITHAFQPYLDVRRWAIVGHEALVRGPQGEGAASVLHAIHPDDHAAFDLQSRHAALITAQRLGLFDRACLLHLNILSSALAHSARPLLSTLATAAARGISSRRLVFEYTGFTHAEAARNLRQTRNDLRDFGFRVSLDDFGREALSFSLLADLRPDLVKLHPGLVTQIQHEPQQALLVQRLVEACARIGCAVIAKGVETAAESACLAQLGIPLQQGYLFAHPAQDALVQDIPQVSVGAESV